MRFLISVKFFFLCFLISSYSCTYSAFNFAEVKKSLVRIDVAKTYSLRTNAEFGMASGSGFVIDKEKRLIVTNKHVVDLDTQEIKISFHNNQVSTAKIIYIDPLLDISILQADSNVNFSGIKALKLSKAKPNIEKVYLVGDDEGEGLSYLEGEIIDTHNTKDANNGWLLKSKIRSEGGSSGSPLISSAGEVLGLHYSGTASTSFSISSSHLIDILAKLSAGSDIKRNDIGIKFGLLTAGEALFKYTKFAKELKEIIPQADSADNFKFLTINEIAAYSSLYGSVEQESIVLRLNGKPMTHIYSAFNEVDIGVKTITILGKSGIKTFDVLNQPYVEIPQKHFLFSGAVFRDIGTLDRYSYNLKNDYKGVLCVFSSSNSPIGAIASKNENGGSAFAVIKVDGISIRGLDDFIKYVDSLKPAQPIDITYEDHSNGGERDTKEVKPNSIFFGTQTIQSLKLWKNRHDS